MGTLFKCSQKLISDLAEELDMGCICYVNLDTRVYETVLGDSYAICFEEGDEMQQEIFDKIDSWKNIVKIEPPISVELFEIMEIFTEECISKDNPLSKQLYKALSSSKPFRNFKYTIDDSNFREEWFAFKQQKLEEYVKKELNDIIEKQ